MSAILLCRTGDDAGLAQPILSDRCLIGRGEECDLSLLHPGLSREHALVTVQDGGVLVEDLGSTNGTQLNDEKLVAGEPRALHHLDRLRFGGELDFVFVELSRVPCTEVLAAHLLDVDGERVPLQVGENTVGSADEADLIVTDAEASPIHARLELSAKGLKLVREPGAGPLKVNGEEVETRQLVDGDFVELSPLAQFGIEIVAGFAPAPDVHPEDQTTPQVPVFGRRTQPPTPVEESAAAPLEEPEAGPAEEAEVSPVQDEPVQDEPVQDEPDHDATATLERTEIQDALRKAKARREAELAERKRKRAEAQQAMTTARGAAATEEEGTATSLRRTWSAKFPKVKLSPQEASETTSPPMQLKLQAPRTVASDLKAVRREAAVRLVWQDERGEPQAALLREGRHLVGRHDGCRVVLTDASVSREHAEVQVGPQGVLIRDLDSANGTWKGEERLGQSVFRDGDEVRFGRVKCRIEEI